MYKMYTTMHLLFYGVLIFHDSSCIRLKQSARNVNYIKKKHTKSD